MTPERMLWEGSDPFIDVACAVGFDSLSRCSRHFRSTVEVAPGQLRRFAERLSDRPPALPPAPGGGSREEDGASTRPSGRPSQEES